MDQEHTFICLLTSRRGQNLGGSSEQYHALSYQPGIYIMIFTRNLATAGAGALQCLARSDPALTTAYTSSLQLLTHRHCWKRLGASAQARMGQAIQREGSSGRLTAWPLCALRATASVNSM